MITNCRISMLFGPNTEGERLTRVEDISGADETILEYVRRHDAVLARADRPALYLTFIWRDQCNLAFEPSTLVELAARKLALCISCDEE